MTVNNDIKVVKISKKNKKYIVTFSNEIELTVTEDQIVEYRIVKDKVFTKDLIEEIKASGNLSTYFNKTLNYINFKPRTEAEVIDYLKKYELESDQIESIIERLKSIDFINDERYIKSFITECSNKTKGINYVKDTLTRKGIKKEDILKYLHLYEKDQEIDNAYLLALKYSKTITKNPIKKQQLQLSNKLLTSGFSYDIVNKVLSKIELIDESDDTLLKDIEKLKLKGYNKTEIVQKLLMKGYEYSKIKEVINE